MLSGIMPIRLNPATDFGAKLIDSLGECSWYAFRYLDNDNAERIFMFILDVDQIGRTYSTVAPIFASQVAYEDPIRCFLKYSNEYFEYWMGEYALRYGSIN